MNSLGFWKDTAERVVRTFAQSWLALIIGVQGGLLHVPWTASLSVAGLAALVAALNSVVAPATQSAGKVAGFVPDPAAGNPVSSLAPDPTSGGTT